MRILFVSHAEKTHFFNMVPLAWALRCAGHEVRVASQPEMATAIADSGLVAVPLGVDHKWKQVMEEKNDEGWTERVTAVIKDSADIPFDEFVDFFAESTEDYLTTINNPELVDELVAYAREWQPDLVIWEQLTWAGAIAARACGAAHARILWGTDVIARMRADFLAQLEKQPADARRDPMAEWLTATLAKYGCDFDEEIVTGQWTIDTAPKSQRIDLGLPTVPMRYVPYNGRSVLPDWLRETPAKPRVCVTAGVSVRHYFGVDLINIAALHMFADLDVEVVATLVPGPDESVDDAPANARVFDYVPLQGLLPSCAAVVHIGGAGVQSTAMYYGVPQLILPGIWDTELRARKLAEAGAGLAVPPPEMTPERIRDDLARLVTEPKFRAGAERLRQEMLALPSPAEIVPELERRTMTHVAKQLAVA
jgi:glycosyltransferase (activator-dependent family)